MKVGSKLTAVVMGVTIAVYAAPLSAASNTKKMKDDSWVSLSGKIVSTTPSTFVLDYGEGRITVEMDDYDFYPDGRALMANDKVTVYGIVDHDLLEKKTIEASSVYVKNLGTWFYANPADEEAFALQTVTPPRIGQLEVTGTVTSISGREFTIGTGLGAIQVDTMSLGYNPVDDQGFLQVDVGDRVKVAGQIDNALFDEPELSADWIVAYGT